MKNSAVTVTQAVTVSERIMACSQCLKLVTVSESKSSQSVQEVTVSEAVQLVQVVTMRDYRVGLSGGL